MRKPRVLGLALMLFCAGAGDTGGLTIYRIGGADAPPSDLAEGVEFVRLDWAGVQEDQHGSINLMEATPGYIEPQQLDIGVNLAPLIKERGGEVLTLFWTGWFPEDEDEFVLDQDPETVYLGDGHFASHGPTHKHILFDFGGRFLIRRIRFYPRQRFLNDRFVESFIIGTSDGDPLKDSTRELQICQRESCRAFDIVYNVTENTASVIDLELPPTPIQRLLFRAPENKRGIWEIAEFEIYGAGYAPFSGYVSNVIDLGAEASLGAIRWSGRQDQGARVELTVRTGDDPDPNTYWRQTFRGTELSRFDAQGRPLTLKTYKSLESGEKGGVTHDTENWEFWSTPYDFPLLAGEIAASGPRRYVQIRADMRSTQEAGGRLEYVEFAASIPPIASRAVAEIDPAQAIAGQATAFTYKLLPGFEEGDLGFDSIEIATPVEVLHIDAVRISGREVAFEVLRRDAQGFEVRLPRVDVQRTEELVEVDFRAEVFKYGTVFAGWVFDSQRPHEVRQQVMGGNADDLVDNNTLSVGLAEFGRETIGALRLVPATFTPNGDGINDQVRLEYDLLNLEGGVPLLIELYDLAGAPRGLLYAGQAASGRFAFNWDGRDAGGRLLPPGLYLLRLRVEADKDADEIARVVSLAY
jgi:hypothetical protein